jgi:hypothetical protein
LLQLIAVEIGRSAAKVYEGRRGVLPTTSV